LQKHRAVRLEMSCGNLEAGDGNIQPVDTSVDGLYRIVRVVRDVRALDPWRVGDHDVEAISAVQSVGQIAQPDLDAIVQPRRPGVVADEPARHRIRFDGHQMGARCGVECQGQESDVAGTCTQLEDARGRSERQVGTPPGLCLRPCPWTKQSIIEGDAK
jgi:hypothetical protein